MTFLQGFSADLTTLVAQVAPAVVGVHHRQGQGSGFLISPGGFVLTNNHVLRDARCAEVRFRTGEVAHAEVVGGRVATDHAVLRIGADDPPYLNFAHDAAPLVGAPVVAIGAPYRFEGSVSFGVVSALGRSLAVPSCAPLENLVQTDAAVNSARALRVVQVEPLGSVDDLQRQLVLSGGRELELKLLRPRHVSSLTTSPERRPAVVNSVSPYLRVLN